MKIKLLLVMLFLLISCSKRHLGSSPSTGVPVRLIMDGSYNANISGIMYEESSWIKILKESDKNIKKIPIFEINDQFDSKMVLQLINKINDCGYQKSKLEFRNRVGKIEVAAVFESYDSEVYEGLTRISKQDLDKIYFLKDGSTLQIRLDEIQSTTGEQIKSEITISIRKVVVDMTGHSISLVRVKPKEIVFLEFDPGIKVNALLSVSKNIASLSGRPPILVNYQFQGVR